MRRRKLPRGALLDGCRSQCVKTFPSPATVSRENNFDFVRLVAAISVVFSHAFLVAEGTEANEPLVRLSGNQAVLGLIGVFVFFAISGYLVTESYCRSPAPGAFALRRALRIFPGLIVNTLICALVLGPLVTTQPLATYFADSAVGNYIVKTLTLNPVIPSLPGVVFVDNPVGLMVNGSLWTLRPEAMMYAMIVILGIFRLLRVSVAVVLVGAGIAAVCFEQYTKPLGDLGGWAWMLGFFAAGMCLFFLRDRLPFNRWGALFALAALVGFTVVGHLIMLFPLAGAYLTIYAGRRYDRCLDYSRYAGDLSYGIYIYGWPAEDAVIYLSGGRASWWQVFLGALAIALPLAYLSWHLVEHPALRWGRRLSRRWQRTDPGLAVSA
jgi:peptidoglycan/LPS O-acetylase OafA/YrhL